PGKTAHTAPQGPFPGKICDKRHQTQHPTPLFPAWRTHTSATNITPSGRVCGANVLLHPLGDLLGRSTRGEDLGHTQSFQVHDVGLRDDPPTEHTNVGGVVLPEELHHLTEHRHVR